jgi:cytochrome c biogenesis protein CcdA/thiol-disulfide isomerase/thioredoxin
MAIGLLAFFGGVLTILSPCILPVLPFVFSTAEQPFRRSGLPLLAGMAATFAVVSTLVVVGGGWVIHANQWGRWAALLLLGLFALTLIFPELSEQLTRPFTRAGGRLNLAQQTERSPGRSFILGIATGLLWAPCAGPILGLILTGAAIHGARASTTLLLLAYALGAGTSLAIALAAGGKALRYLKKYLGADQWVRRILGGMVLLGVAAIALGWDRGALTQLSRLHTETLERSLVGAFKPKKPGAAQAAESEGIMPELSGVDEWINSKPLSRAALHGKVVLIDFWTYSCINCLRSLPYIQAWADKYKSSGLVVIGVHTPEFAFEKDPDNVKKAVQDLGITYPVATDNNYAVWNAFQNQYWPAHYFIDGSGKIRHHHFGEGEYAESERMIQQLLAELRPDAAVPQGVVEAQAHGVEAASAGDVASPETYVGYSRSQNMLARPSVRRDVEQTYSAPRRLSRNQWTLTGRWKVRAENAELSRAGGKILFRFHARDLHLVLGPGASGKPIHFTVRLNGDEPGPSHGSDVTASGHGVVREERLYQLIRRIKSGGSDPLFEIEFAEPGVQAFAFTFG